MINNIKIETNKQALLSGRNKTTYRAYLTIESNRQ